MIKNFLGNILKGLGAVFLTVSIIFAIDLGLSRESGQPVTKSIWDTLTGQLETNTDKITALEAEINNLKTSPTIPSGSIIGMRRRNGAGTNTCTHMYGPTNYCNCRYEGSSGYICTYDCPAGTSQIEIGYYVTTNRPIYLCIKN